MRQCIVKCIALSVSAVTMLAGVVSLPGWGAKLLPAATHHVKAPHHKKAPPKHHPGPASNPVVPASRPAKTKTKTADQETLPKSHNSPAKIGQAGKKGNKLLSEREKNVIISAITGGESRATGTRSTNNNIRVPAANMKNGSESGSQNGGAVSINAQKKPSPALLSSLGFRIFADETLSDPVGESCLSCHAGKGRDYTSANAAVNAGSGLMPGAVAGRHTQHRVPTISYVPGPDGLGIPLHHDPDLGWVGGLGWDGRFSFEGDEISRHPLHNQIHFPIENTKEMNSTRARVVHQIKHGTYAQLFEECFGENVFNQPTDEVFSHAVQAVTAFERSPEVSPFTSKWDAWQLGRYTPTASELRGFQLMTGSYSGRPGGQPYIKVANCVQCHGIKDTFNRENPELSDSWSNSCYINIGPPINPDNPFDGSYNNNQAVLGLSAHLYPALYNLPPGNLRGDGRGDFLQIRGAFKTPTLRNAALRLSFFHNASKKTLMDVLDFYNERNLTDLGERIDYTQCSGLMSNNPHDRVYRGPAGRELQGQPRFVLEYPDANTLQNAEGAPANPPGGPPNTDAQVGNLGLTDQDKLDIIAAINALTDGFFVR